ncbi:hypothetical protein ACHAQH_007531 [Verticillium albo-atrum]
MAPKTRSGGKPEIERVYHSSPALKQTKFPHKRTTIRGYGQRPKNLRRKIAARESSPVEAEVEEETSVNSPKQSTLTQYNWVDRIPIEDEGDPDRPQGKKRRKTEGDAPNSSPPRSTFHTQTLTQRYPELSFSSKDDDPANLQIDDSEDEKLSLVFGDAEMGNTNAGQVDESAEKENSGLARTSRTPSAVPQTPTNKRIRRDVIPSSQDSPLTPMLARYSPANKRSPLKHKSTNIMAPLPEIPEVPKIPRPRGMIIEDSTITKSPTSSTIDPSPGKENRDPEKINTSTVKAVRFVTPRPSQLMRPPQSKVLGEISVLEDEVTEASAERDVSPSPVGRRSTPKPTEREIADSDDEFDELGDSYPVEDEDDYRIPNIVTRMWIYVTAPVSMLKYMAVISNHKQPGEIEETGVGNAEFNAGKKQNSFAYELQDVYELNNPVSLAEMKEHGWVAGPPQKYNYVPPTVVGHLMANLRCSLFGEEEEDQAADSPLLDDLPSELGPVDQHHKSPTASKYTISQEVEKQILSEATLQNTSDPDLLVSSSSSQERRRLYNAMPAAPALKFPSKLPPTPFNRLPNPNPSSTTRRSVRLSQATTASQASSPPTSPTKTAPRRSRATMPSSSLSLLPLEDNDSPIQLPSGEFSLDTSQLLTKSQMLPESVLQDDDPIEDDDEVVYETD